MFFLAEKESHIYPNICAKFGCGLTVVSKKKWGGTDRQTDRQTKGRCSFIYSVVDFIFHNMIFLKHLLSSVIYDTGMGPFKCYIMQMGVGKGCVIFQKKRYEGVRFNVIYRYKGVSGGPISRKKALRNA